MDVVDSLDFCERPENYPLISAEACNYIIVFLVSPISGKNEDGKLWDRLIEIRQKIPVITFYRAAYMFNQNPVAKSFFNVSPIREEQGYIRDVTFSDETLGQDVQYPSVQDPASGYTSTKDKDYFITIAPVKSDGDFKILMRLRDKVVASQFGLNIFVGQRGVALPREDRAFELDRPIYYLRLLDNLLKKSPAGYLRLKLPKQPVVLRMDDPPATWQQRPKRTLAPECYSKIVDLLSKHGAKMTCFITPAAVSKDGQIKPWTDTDCDYAKIVLGILRNASMKGSVEIGIHGLTHLTIGYRPPSKLQGLFRRIGLCKYNLAREFYDSNLRKSIPYELQKKQLERSVELIRKFFGCSPRVFAPPAHVWDDSTEEVILELGIPYLSADMNFYFYPEGHDFRKNPSPLGETSCKGKLLYVSATILGNYGTFKKTLKLFNDLGIPVVWQQHNYLPSWFTPEILESFFGDVETLPDKAYMSISELGDLMRNYEKIQSHATLEKGLVECEIKTEMPVVVEAYYSGKKESRYIPLGYHRLEIDLRR